MITVSVFCSFTTVLMFVFVEYVTDMKRRGSFFLSLFFLFPHRAFPLIQRGMQENHTVVFIDDVNADVSEQQHTGTQCVLLLSACFPLQDDMFIYCSSALTNTSRHDSCSHRKKKANLDFIVAWGPWAADASVCVCVCVHLINRGKHSKNVPSSYMPNALLPRVLADCS